MPNDYTKEVTVGELILHLQAYDPSMHMYFNGLTFYRLKDRGPYVQMEFNETVYEDENGNITVEKHS